MVEAQVISPKSGEAIPQAQDRVIESLLYSSGNNTFVPELSILKTNYKVPQSNFLSSFQVLQRKHSLIGKLGY